MKNKKEKVMTIIEGDFNARTGVEGGGVVEENEMEKLGQCRTSKDRRLDRENRTLLESSRRKDKIFITGWYGGDKERKYVFT